MMVDENLERSSVPRVPFVDETWEKRQNRNTVPHSLLQRIKVSHTLEHSLLLSVLKWSDRRSTKVTPQQVLKRRWIQGCFEDRTRKQAYKAHSSRY